MPPLLVFSLDQLRLALPLTQVRETVRAVAITPLAGAPGVVEGVVNVRGAVVPALDLRARFHLPPRPVALSDHMIVASAGARQVILRVDRTLEVLTVAEDEVTPLAREGAAFAHLAGVARLPDGMVFLHDLEAFLSQGEEEALAAALERDRELARVRGGTDDADRVEGTTGPSVEGTIGPSNVTLP